jgi:hypothetical protein
MDHIERFDDWTGFVRRAKVAGDPKGSSHAKADYGEDPDWAGATWEAAVKLAEQGWPEGYDAVRKASEALYGRVTLKMPLPETVWHETPTTAVLDMGRFVEGDPGCWIETNETEVYADAPSNKTVHIVANIAASWNVPTSVIFTRGAAIVALAEALELVGRAVKISIVEAVSGFGHPFHCEFWATVKEYDQRANYDVLAFALCHGATLRRLCFAIAEGTPTEVKNTFGFNPHGGYGIPTDTAEANRGDIYLPKAYGRESQWQNPDAAEQWVLEQLNAQGVHID